MEKILIIQDSPSMNAMFKFRLEAAGFFVETAESGEEGIEKTKEAQYQLILLDYTLPGMDGAEVCRILKSQEHGKDIPVVFMSAKDQGEIRKITQGSGANGYLCLPLEGKELVEKLKSLIKKEL